ncbi:Hypothetical predicted protein, partial [Paramuricea clavata]
DGFFAKGNHNVAIIKASKDYEVFKRSFGDVFNSVNELNERKQMEVNGTNINWNSS